MAFSSQRLEASLSPQVAEVVALKKGIEFTVDIGLVLAVIESDALGVVNLVNLGESNSTKIGLFIDDIVSRLHCRGFGSVVYVHMKANFVAHFLSKFTMNLSEDLF
ncbi:hypothetical protein LWI28_026283 [Acer negundo]|uniref:RNase H type-1 domain-containing protein n=1 Tax=Acer negundo TaxID=4023 RepID=A0AAD5JJ63_ACENE|nr:hypothetical protein LWI28_026283 [Acer negundo]